MPTAAPDTAEYILINPDPLLPIARSLAVGDGLAKTDTGAGGIVTILPAGNLLALQSLTALDTGILVKDGLNSFTTFDLTSDGSIDISQALDSFNLSINDDTSIQQVAVQQSGVLKSVRSNLNFIAGVNMGITIQNDGANNRTNVTLSAGAAGGVAPANASYITKIFDPALPNSQGIGTDFPAGGVLKSTPTGTISISTLLTSLEGVPITEGTILHGTVGGLLTNLAIGASGTVLTSDGVDVSWVAPAAAAPITASFLTQVPEVGFTGAQALSTLVTGVLQSTTGTGVVSNAPNVTTIESLTPTVGNLLRGSATNTWETLSIGVNGTILTSDGTNAAWVANSAAPADATYITQTSSGSLSAEQALADLSTGILKSTTLTGVLSISTPLTDIDAITPSTGTILVGNGTTWTPLAVGVAGQLLGVVSGTPSWAATHVGKATIPALGSSITVPSTIVNSNSRILLTWNGDPMVAGILYVNNIVDGVSFDAVSTTALGASSGQLSWFVVNT